MSVTLWVTPHQDDETLSEGSAIRHHLEAGHEVHVLLLTTGVNSGARAKTPLTPAQFVEARDDELFRATRELGVRRSNVHIAPSRTDDGALTVDAAEAMILAWLLDHPGAMVKSYSNLPAAGRHEDHIAAGQAAYNVLAAAGQLGALRLYVEPWLVSAFRTANPGVNVGPERASGVAAVRRAFDEYEIADKPAGKWGIGYLSVAAKFEALRQDPACWYHVPVVA